MVFCRIKQFVWAFQSIFKELDDDYVNKYLLPEEKKLFNKLKKSDRAHSIRVSKDNLLLLGHTDNQQNKYLNKKQLAKIGLLHDIGKIERPLNIFEKSTIVILDKITNGKLKNYSNIKVIDVYYNHPKKGVSILKKYSRKDKEYSLEFLQAIELHHTKNTNLNNKILQILEESDSKN